MALGPSGDCFLNAPHLTITLPELLASSSSKWVGRLIRTFGYMVNTSIEEGVAFLETKDGPHTFSVKLNLENISPLRIGDCELYCVFGEVTTSDEGEMEIVVKILRPCLALDMDRFLQALEILRRRLPRILK